MAEKITLAGPSEPCECRYDTERLLSAAENAAGYANAALAFARGLSECENDDAAYMQEMLDDVAEELLFSLVKLMGWDAVRILVDRWKPAETVGNDGGDA